MSVTIKSTQDKSISTQSKDSVASEVFSTGSKLPFKAQNIIGLYLDEQVRESIEENSDFTFVQSFTNLSDRSVLKTYLASSEHLNLAHPTLEKIYETSPRIIKSTNCGMSFPAEPEILAYLMKISKNKTVLEIAGASGEHSILLAFSGAKKVYMNDLDSGEIRDFKLNVSRLPKEIQGKLVCLEGDIFDRIKAVKSKMDVILCRNFIHFLTDTQQEAFFSLLKDKLEDGGKVVFLANSVYAVPPVLKLVKTNPTCSSFKTVNCLVTDRLKSTAPLFAPFQEFTCCSSDKVSSTKYTTAYLYERALGGKWVVDNKAFKTLEPETAKKAREAIKDCNNTIKKIKCGSVRVLTSHLRVYSEESLSSVLKSHGFTVDQVFIAKKDGHLAMDNESLEKVGQQVGVIATVNS